MKEPMRLATLAIAMAAWGVLEACGNDAENPLDDSVFAGMANAVADCEFDVVTFAFADGERQVHINDLPVAELPGASLVSSNAWEVVTRRGVRFSDILARAGITISEDTPVNCVARDGFDPLRTKLANDTAKLPTFGYLSDHGYVYVGSPGDKDPLYPEMEGKSLIVDYDAASDAEVPAHLGGKLASLGMFRWKMIERIDDQTRGIIEIDPVVQ